VLGSNSFTGHHICESLSGKFHILKTIRTGTSVDLTGIANNAKLVVLNFLNVSMSTSSNFLINLILEILK
jgi:hypothetical protein